MLDLERERATNLSWNVGFGILADVTKNIVRFATVAAGTDGLPILIERQVK